MRTATIQHDGATEHYKALYLDKLAQRMQLEAVKDYEFAHMVKKTEDAYFDCYIHAVRQEAVADMTRFAEAYR